MATAKISLECRKLISDANSRIGNSCRCAGISLLCARCGRFFCQEMDGNRELNERISRLEHLMKSVKTSVSDVHEKMECQGSKLEAMDNMFQK